ncbi:hypothetical protein ACQE3E_08580 [Methylomonas sp. MED-D]|uniref:Uncharacterized protein n=1 Tax=Methylomonas koyamae TaxID=702114 RepID=A0A177NAT1_9GAMM|nr:MULTISPECIES: hypothetical protein [Methylomonas]NJA04892.1 hypothetical protein [Methylococcaceae bacterium WWC4]MDT4329039.1 hypothetical protein [Methylomonas sp. MV1]OAI14972.1 hypothetical protein A1355_11895 [Methylomonas koyamae]OHX35302.1 hypothetical protein BJL95_01810 [Methylomonas sp. LWB]WGS87749.1 hypothetical protein QC632_08305 [Methylomonas sp. UP202]
MSKKASRIATSELAQFASQGLNRALEVRELAGQELSPEQLAQVSGGVALLNWNGIINGGRLLQQLQVAPQLDAGLTLNKFAAF